MRLCYLLCLYIGIVAFCISLLRLKFETFSLFFPCKLYIFYHLFWLVVFFSLSFIEHSRKASLTNVSLSSVFSVILFTVNISYNSFLLLLSVITGKSEKGNMESCTSVCSLCYSNGHCSKYLCLTCWREVLL